MSDKHKEGMPAPSNFCSLRIENNDPHGNTYREYDKPTPPWLRYPQAQREYDQDEKKDREAREEAVGHQFPAYVVYHKVKSKLTKRKLTKRERKWKPKQWLMDSGAGGGGGAIFDLLVDDRQFKRKIIGINNASKTVDYKSGRTKAIIKEDLYNNLKRLMEAGEIKLLKNTALRESLLSIQFEWTDSGNFRIFGSNSHITEALIRACWCRKSKQLNIRAFC